MAAGLNHTIVPAHDRRGHPVQILSPSTGEPA